MTELGGATGRKSSAPPDQDADPPIRVLVVDDEPAVRNSIARGLRKAGMVPHACEGGEEASVLLEREPFDVVLLDFRMPGMTGPQLLDRMKAAGHSAEVIMMTACADVATTVSTVRAGASRSSPSHSRSTSSS